MSHVVVIGAGFCGLAAGYELSKRGVRVTILERDEEIGGLAGSFLVQGARLEKFYHHWFTNDEHVMKMIGELGCQDQVVERASRTGMYFANNFFKLSTPLDLMRFKPLSMIDRIRLGLLALRVRRVRDWKKLESLTAAEWLRSMGGNKVFEVVWEPLLHGKFGDLHSEVSAVWFWNKLKLRGGSRGKAGGEKLAYYRGGFSALADQIARSIEATGGRIITGRTVDSLVMEKGNIIAATVAGERISADAFLATPALPIIADLLQPHISEKYLASLKRIKYLANICLVLELDRSLSDIYWLNVNDPGFPFVAVIEHTNFEPPDSYGGRRIVYLSKYLPASSKMFQMSDSELIDFTIPYIKKMFPSFSADWILQCNVWRARYAQPVVERNYSKLIPSHRTPIPNLHIATMAQIYPEDRGTNYAIGQGRQAAKVLLDECLV